MTSKKLLVAFSAADLDAKSSDFLVPVVEEGSPHFIGVKSRKPVEMGMMIFVGRDITMNDLFAKLVDTGRKIANVEGCVKVIDSYLQMLQEYKIGNILAIEPSGDHGEGFQLKKIANTPGGIKNEQ